MGFRIQNSWLNKNQIFFLSEMSQVREAILDHLKAGSLLTRDEQRKLIQSFDQAKVVADLTDSDLVECVVGEILNGVETGSREEALLNELVDRFSVLAGTE